MPILIYILFAFMLGSAAIAQELPEFRSIHQIEMEKYRNYKIPEKDMPPAFSGKPMPLQQRSNPPSHEVFGYLPYWVYNNYPNLNYDLLTTIAYFGANVNANGNITNDYNWPASGLINTAHANGVRVLLTAILFDSNALAALLSNPAARTNLVNNLLNSVQSAGADGVNIDFEGVPSGQRENLSAFMTELSDAFHSAIPGSFVTIFTPAVDWRNVFDYNALAEVTDGLVIQGYDYHWSGSSTAGPNSPLTGNRWGFFNITWTVNDYIAKTGGNVDKLIQTVPFYGFEWPTADGNISSPTTGSGSSVFYPEAFSNAQTYGRLWDAESQTPWYRYQVGSQWYQGWYDDSLSIALKFNFIKNKGLKGTGIWALSYDGQRLELQGALSDAFGATAPPLRPDALRVTNTGDGRVRVASRSASGATSYWIFRSTDGVNFDNGTNYPGPVNTLANLSPDSTYYFRMSAANGNGESSQTEVLGARPKPGNVAVLLVNGFDRTVGTNNTFDFVKRFGPAIANAGYAFDACANEAIIDGQVLLGDYPVVVWISGEEGTADESFSNAEQALLAQYLQDGGRLFISGSEIGYDLVDQGTPSDQFFYSNFLKAQYIRDKVDTYNVTAVSGGIFEGLSNFSFDNGSHGTYNVDFPDGINPRTGAQLCLSYVNFNPATFGGAGIQYEGTFSGGSVPGRLVYLAFPFETIYPASVRDNVMERVLTYLSDGAVGVANPPIAGLPQSFELLQNYPNPFNPQTTIPYRLSKNSDVKLSVYNSLGQLVKTLVSANQPAGEYRVTWDGSDASGRQVASGVYFYQLQTGGVQHSRQMLLLR